ncbi:CvpA family protein [Candidatus Uhrbacteria bacterium]|nr:CvpA family protein [Candidatus Uhrbacteria bacterium]
MTTLDLIFLVILCVFFVIGFTRGLIKQVGSLLGYFVALWAANMYHGPVTEYIKTGLTNWQPFLAGPLSVVLGYVGAYILAYFLWHLLINIIDGAFRLFSIVPLLNMTNRLGGAAVGLAEGVLLLAAGVYIFSTFPLSSDITATIKRSQLVPVFDGVVTLVKPLLPSVIEQGPKLFDLKNIQNLKLPANVQGEIDITKLNPQEIREYMKQLGITEKDLPPEIGQLLREAEKKLKKEEKNFKLKP